MWKHFLNEYFVFTAKERKGIIVIITLIVLVILFPLSYSLFIKQRTYNYSEFENEVNSLHAEKTDSPKVKNYYAGYDKESNNDYTSS
jgi:hypothetical protein